ncbi:MAG: nucleotidyltransferase domain-containing protein [Spirochaetaceae bacterium]|nr:MAG: nucleotidyltransferase domain-containing protein [Spirochaetaceae bacterium]
MGLGIATNYLKSVGCSEIYLFGSVAEGNAREASDFDIAVRSIPAKKFFAIYGELLSRISRPVDLVDIDLQANLGRRILANTHIKRVA